MKICGKCKKELDKSSFAKKGKTLQSACKQCHRVYSKNHYTKNKSYYLAKTKIQQKHLRQILKTIKENIPCTDCKKYFPSHVMDFDHLRDKKKNVSQTVNASKALMQEIAKCELVCANCHRIRTFKRASGGK